MMMLMVMLLKMYWIVVKVENGGNDGDAKQ